MRERKRERGGERERELYTLRRDIDRYIDKEI